MSSEIHCLKNSDKTEMESLECLNIKKIVKRMNKRLGWEVREAGDGHKQDKGMYISFTVPEYMPVIIENANT